MNEIRVVVEESTMAIKIGFLPLQATLLLIVSFLARHGVLGLGSMSSIAVSYGENGPVFCGLVSDGSHLINCYGADASIVYGAPVRLPLLGLTAGDGFVCGLLLDSRQPYCWGSNMYVKMGVPQPMEEGVRYSQISAGDCHLCALRVTSLNETQRGNSVIDCWGYNMTASHVLSGGAIDSVSAGSVFNCGLFARNRTVFCWGDDTGSGVISLAPRNVRFRSISAGGYHVCGILQNAQVFCWGTSLEMKQPDLLGEGNVKMVPMDPMVSVVGGRFHACGIRSLDHKVSCWGFALKNTVPTPTERKFLEIVAGDYFTCGVISGTFRPFCWGTGGPWSVPMAVSPGVCTSAPCGTGYYEYIHTRLRNKICKPANSRICLPCSIGCLDGSSSSLPCNATLYRGCRFNCSSCTSESCPSYCSALDKSKPRRKSFFSVQMPVFVAEISLAIVLAVSIFSIACMYVRHKLRGCKCTDIEVRAMKNQAACSFNKDSLKIQPELDELNIRRAQVFTYEELDEATGGFCEDSQVGKGSFSCVFKGILKNGTVVAVKRAIKASSDMKKTSKEFHTELDLLSRLNHAHLLNLLGYCEEGGERLLVYEFMAHGSLYQHLHGKDPNLKRQLNWVRRVTIAVQAARGIEYLHGYACPPVIHRDIKSSNILIDEEHNARVSDFGLSLLGPTDSSTPLSELPAGTLGYLDPEYYRLHYLTTKSDVYSFGVLLLEILSGRKAIDMQFEEGNIVQWAVPLIKSEDISSILDPGLNPPNDLEALKKIANVAYKCVRMRGKDRPSMDKVTTALERALALLMGSPCNEQPILPTEVVLGSSRMHKKASQRSSTTNLSCSENELVGEGDEQTIEYRAPSWITFPSVTSSQRRKSSASEADTVVEGRNVEGRSVGGVTGDTLRCLEEEIGPASPQEDLFLQHNF